MKKSILLSLTTALLLAFSITACGQHTVKGSKNYITKQVSVRDFKGIKLTGSPNVIYTQKAGAPSVEIYGPDNIVPLIETYVENSNLIIRYKKNTGIRNSGNLEVRVSAPAINQLIVTGSGDIVLKNGISTSGNLAVSISGSGNINGNKIKCNGFSAKISGSGDIDLKGMEVSQAEMRISGSGTIYVAGKCVDATYSISGSGDIQGINLKADHVDARITGSGTIKCYASQSLSGKVSGSGDVAYKGSPKTIEFSRRGLHKL